MKRTLSLILAVVMVLSSSIMAIGAATTDSSGLWAPDNTKFDAISKEGVVARFAIGADIHFEYYASAEKTTHVYNILKQIGGVDAYLIAGDLTHYGVDENYKSLMKYTNMYTKNNPANPDATGDSVGMTIFAMGNHEYGCDANKGTFDGEAQFTKWTKQNPDTLYWVNGIPVISISPDAKTVRSNGEDYNNFDSSEKFLADAYAEIDGKGYRGLIIMIAHQRPDVDGTESKYWSDNAMNLIKSHPNTMVYTGHSHTWFHRTQQYIHQDGGFTHVRAGSLGNGYGGIGSNYINARTGTSSDIAMHYSENDTCSFVLVDILKDGRARLRQVDVSKGIILFEDEEFYVRPDVLTDYIYDTDNANFKASYGNGSKAPSFPSNMNITWKDMGNNSSVKVIFDPATAATSLAKDFVAEYRIRLVDADGNYVMNGSKNYFRVANYRPESKENEPWEVMINGLAWDTDYTMEIKAYNAYGKATSWVKSTEKANVGHGTPIYPAVPVIDFDYSYGSVADGAGHQLIGKPSKVKDVEIDGQKAVNLLGIGSPYVYEFTEADYQSVRNYYTIEAYFSASDVSEPQCILGGWGSAPVALKIHDGNIYFRSQFVSTVGDIEADMERLPYEIKANTWYHVIGTYDSNTIRLYVNGELVAEESGYFGGMANISYEVEADEENPDAVGEKITRSFAVGAGRYDGEGDSYQMSNCKINKAALYSGCMTAEDVKNAYKVATTAVPFTDVEDGWYIDSVEYAYATGLMNGSSATTFSPAVKTSRAMIVQMLYNLEGRPAVDKSNNPFTDVASTAWYADAVLWAYQSGVTTGTSATTFSPDGLVTREQVAVFLYRYRKDYKKAEMGEGADLSAFPDANKISPYAGFADAMAWANASGIIGGKKNGSDVTLSPLDQAMRSEVAKMFVSFDKKF